MASFRFFARILVLDFLDISVNVILITCFISEQVFSQNKSRFETRHQGIGLLFKASREHHPAHCLDVSLAGSGFVHISQLINWIYSFHIGLPVASHLINRPLSHPTYSFNSPALDGRADGPPPAAGSYRFSRSGCSCPANDPTWASRTRRVRGVRRAPCTCGSVPANCPPRSWKGFLISIWLKWLIALIGFWFFQFLPLVYFF